MEKVGESGTLPLNAGVLSTKELLKNLLADATSLVKAEVELARAELKRDVRREMALATGMGTAALLAYAGILMLLVALTFALAQLMPGWLAALVVAALVLGAAAISGAIGWARRVRSPLERTRREAQATLALARERVR
jgi:uncharacterized membrane protein YqjE